MEILREEPTVKAGTDRFVGDAWYDVIARGEAPLPIGLSGAVGHASSQ